MEDYRWGYLLPVLALMRTSDCTRISKTGENSSLGKSIVYVSSPIKIHLISLFCHFISVLGANFQRLASV